MTNVNPEELEGTTLNVYSYVVKEGKSVGPREVMRATNLTSPSVAHWHLQKLEGLGLLTKTEYGEYTVKEKVNVSGHLWVGRKLVPRLIFHSFFFMGILIIELGLLAYPLIIQGQAPSIYLYYLISPTAIATVLFLAEGMWLTKKIHAENRKKPK
ncbi:MAG: hypothetical protein M1540_03925 [Candidatus Bathyarchaeota archaeon]|nr:hypothetical protein [Candidatus Bathyarchaeota archaeon]